MASKASLNAEIPKFVFEGEAACAQVDPELFFSVDTEDAQGRIIGSSYPSIQQAKSVCGGCELKFDCLAYAVKTGVMGIWGGTTEAQRNSLRRNRRPA